jgi:hypothetical protein
MGGSSEASMIIYTTRYGDLSRGKIQTEPGLKPLLILGLGFFWVA